MTGATIDGSKPFVSSGIPYWNGGGFLGELGTSIGNVAGTTSDFQASQKAGLKATGNVIGPIPAVSYGSYNSPQKPLKIFKFFKSNDRIELCRI